MLLWTEKAGFCSKKHVGFQQFFQQQFQFYHTQELILTGFLHHNQQRKKGCSMDLDFRWKNNVVENSLINSPEWNQEERVKKPSLEQVSVSRELQMCQESSWCSEIAKLAQAQLLQPLQTRSVQVPRLLHIFINQTKPTQTGFFLTFLFLQEAKNQGSSCLVKKKYNCGFSPRKHPVFSPVEGTGLYCGIN